ncbi:DCC1-like thiol-disulfide oxidoreductase family protein [Pelagicoccus albus]|uniref:DUF393 domain-containing protein n=1 Tax=Pelagicoccus albus TaxID=415222 RepID=A0A7X1E9K0_9BACT|nr:DUF393 domain-containing protein [Pelagicoccus albus]
MVAEKNIIFFDGVCGFCDKTVNLLLKLDDRQALYFSPIQGEAAKEILPPERRENVDTISYYNGDRLFYRTDALLEVGKTLGGIWWLFYPLKVIPAEWRDVAYDWFAKRRYRFFGKMDSCRMPTPEERARFLD